MTIPYETINVKHETLVRTVHENEVPTKRQNENDNEKCVTNTTSVEERTTRGETYDSTK